ncbi:Protein of unknown function (DUF3099) [Parafrankia irregularis]|uniref:DUF3099 domain-containing protein n=1 Tax=Parafrankia irregularis TaxID=795642 RepID=A0A0S4QG60_9ACTN|nr:MULTISPECIES: DUF3099 domain-containing protein [Parafrankia]MBE3199612.1 DUF3099 domain-containing protein [Parafrankia sp. CH37]CUU53720.1 Protein of unknown function (DUF3099) [Parafrankia irregularis]
MLITSAAEARPEEIRRREQRYVLTMLVRVVCFVLAVVAFSGWLRIVAVALAVILPWIAVVVANGGPAPSDRRQAGFVAKDATTTEPLSLAAGHTIVDATVVDGEQPGDPPPAAAGSDSVDHHDDDVRVGVADSVSGGPAEPGGGDDVDPGSERRGAGGTAGAGTIIDAVVVASTFADSAQPAREPDAGPAAGGPGH